MKFRARRYASWLTLLFLFLSGAALLAAGALRLQREYLTRGIPPGFPPFIPHGSAEPALNVALEQYEGTALATELQQIAQTGVDTVKQTFYFDDQPDWEQSDRLVTAVTGAGLQLVPLLDGNPAGDFAPPRDPATFAAWAGEFAARYGQQIRYYIVWDEPNLTSHWGFQAVNPAEYAALLAATATAIRETDPDAVIIAAPLAPTRETGPENLAEHVYLHQLYEAGAAGAFDVVAGKPYGFDSGPDDRRVDPDVLNFSRIILLREEMVAWGDEHKAVWAGNWGWNSLPAGWDGAPSIWGQTDEATRAARTADAVRRARQEWPWMGLMFLENWEPAAPAVSPRWGFSVAGRATAEALRAVQAEAEIAYPGFHPARATAPAQEYQGEWRFSPEFGADIPSEADVTAANATATFRFWGTDLGLRVRRAGFRARLYAWVDGLAANALPRDENGPALVLTAAGEGEEFLSTDAVATGLPPGEHTLALTAHRGWDQWALNGYSVAYHPPAGAYRWSLLALALTFAGSVAAAFYFGRMATRQGAWGALSTPLRNGYRRLGSLAQQGLGLLLAAVVALSGWLTWGEQAAGIYRRLGDQSQLALTAAAASLFYVTPFFFVYLLALILLFFFIYARPAWGVALVAFTIPFFVQPKPMLGYRFSPVEVFLLVTLLAWAASCFVSWRAGIRDQRSKARLPIPNLQALISADYAVLAFVAVATLSLLFTERLDVATNEWRVVIVEPALFYLLLRVTHLRKKEMWRVVDAFILGGVAVALYGLGFYALCQGGVLERDLCERAITTTASGVGRLRAIYGSPNNLALYLGRILPFLVAMLLLGRRTPRRRRLYTVASLPVGLALLLTFSKGALFLGLPAALLVVFWQWQRQTGRRLWPWLAGVVALAGSALLLILNYPPLAGRLDVGGATSVFRLQLWQASLNMITEHPLLGVGLDNFLYAYRGRYIFEGAWQEPYLNHPHNILLDFTTRLGLLGLLAGIWLLGSLARHLWQRTRQVPAQWRPVLVGMIAAFVDMLAHGLVDHSFFLVDLSFVFYFLLGLAVWLQQELSGRT